MIVLFNNNSYVGGGETLLIRLARFLHFKGVRYTILGVKESWLSVEAERHGLHMLHWPTASDSIIYQSAIEKATTASAVIKLFDGEPELKVFTFCFRDLHNAMHIFTKALPCRVTFSHGIYHPEDVYYLSSYSLRAKSIVKANQKLAQILYAHQSVLFINRNGFDITLDAAGDFDKDDPPPTVIPLPINIEPDAQIPPKSFDPACLHIICISRFVSFKIGAIVALIRYISGKRNVRLSIIGHGPFEPLLRVLVRVKKLSNVSIITGIGPSALDRYIDGADIGYAQGTSILEIAKRGKPVIVAPYSRLSDIFRTRYRPLGIFGEIKDFTVFGDITDVSQCKTYTIEECVDSIVKNYASISHLTQTYVREFASEIVCDKIYRFIEAARLSNQNFTYSPISPPVGKYAIKRVSAKMAERPQ